MSAINVSPSVSFCLSFSTSASLHPSLPLSVLQGHAAPVLYAVWAETGYLKESELVNLRKVDSILEGHPVPVSWDSGSAF